MAKQLSTPRAILAGLTIAGALIALAVYLGLRSTRDADRAAGDTSASSAATARRALSPQARAAAREAARRRALQSAKAKLEQHRPRLRKECWAPIASENPDAGKSRLVWNMTFSAQGQMLARGMSEDRQASVPGVGACISRALPLFRIPPPGAQVRVEVPFELP